MSIAKINIIKRRLAGWMYFDLEDYAALYSANETSVTGNCGCQPCCEENIDIPIVAPTVNCTTGCVEIVKTDCIVFSSSRVFDTNAAAIVGGLSVGQLYQTSTGEVRVVVTPVI